MDEKIYAMWLADALSPGSVHGKTLIEKYGSFSEIYRLTENDYAEAGVKRGSQAMKRLLDKSTAKSEKNYGFCNYNYFGIIEYTADAYPKRLKSISNPPPVLYTRGRMIDIDDNVCIGVVGTRSYTDVGWNSVYKVAGGIARCGAVVVTGLASGIDTAATRAALEGQGFAIGVIGGGIERIYPSENTELFETMYKCGLVISELAPFSNITGSYFPVRNRIISGLCQGVLVGEGNVKSGAMITAKHAGEQGRHIFAIPGDINSEESSGVNKLIREGATPVFESRDIIEKYAYLYPHRIKSIPKSDDVKVPESRSSKRIRFLGAKKSSAQEKKNADIYGNTKTEVYDTPAFSEIPVSIKKEPAKEQLQTLEILSAEERAVYDALSYDTAKNSDMISAETSMPSDKVLSAFTTLEIAGLIKKLPHGIVKI